MEIQLKGKITMEHLRKMRIKVASYSKIDNQMIRILKEIQLIEIQLKYVKNNKSWYYLRVIKNVVEIIQIQYLNKLKLKITLI